ncbi:hypothetical protein [Erwinia psidii]|uniref:Uncharacterized protein n=1 Tax=Erwinia psidii TaxID=69224 RepID=A0A3N6RUE1_9GAMM|nr:hypothetical protein [Erwinia psidii]MCX8958744.1 hypothetical protein [Erwinia psidii]MCX8963024.1 hypothetical protein [Erwinia psidii]MCX8967360.1 hypothetical protein [Erwinia psidii]RQM36598.1 hypothetical protein EB241_19430 [Erwinia psidii]
MKLQKEKNARFSTNESPVNVYTESHLPEEAIVGIMDDIRVLDWDTGLKALIPKETCEFLQKHYEQRFPEEWVVKARQEVNIRADIRRAEGIRVRRPDELNHQPVVTPHFTTGGIPQRYAGCNILASV